MVAQQTDIYQDFADFIASLSPEKLVNYYAPLKMQARVDWLIARKKSDEISPDEAAELEKYFVFEHIVRLAKARALKLVGQKRAA